MRKRVILILIIIALISTVLLLLFMNTNLIRGTKETTPHIEVIIKSTDFDNFPFWNVVKQGIETASEDFQVTYSINGPIAETEIDLQISMIYQAIENKPDAIVLAAADFKRLIPIAEEIAKAGIPLITIDSFIDSDAAVTEIGTDNVTAGEKAGLVLTDFIEPGSQVAIISYVKETSSQIDREQGVKNVLSDTYSIVGTWYSGGNIHIAETQVETILEEYPNLKGLVALNEQSTVGAARALIDKKETRPVTLVGFDNSTPIIGYLEKDIIEAIIVQKPFNMGYLGIRHAVEIIQGKSVPPVIDTGLEIITKENMYQTENQKLLFPVNSN